VDDRECGTYEEQPQILRLAPLAQDDSIGEGIRGGPRPRSPGIPHLGFRRRTMPLITEEQLQILRLAPLAQDDKR